MNSMEYAHWMNAANNTTSGRDLFSQEEMEHIEAYFYDPVNNLPVFVAKTQVAGNMEIARPVNMPIVETRTG